MKKLTTGLFIVPGCFIGFILALRKLKPDMVWTGETYLAVAVISLVVCLVLIATDQNPRDQNVNYDGRSQALRPTPPKDMLYKTPTGFCFGKWGKSYVCKRVEEPGSILVQGGSGSGKSASLIQGFLLNPENRKNCNSLVLDIKKELLEKTVLPEEIYRPDNPEGSVIVLDPTDRKMAFGFDPLYGLSDESSDMEVHERMEIIAQCIVPVPKGDGAIWAQGAQRLFIGAATYFYEEEGMRTLPDIIRAIKSTNIRDMVDKIVSSAMIGGAAYSEIIGYQGLADETLGSFSSNLDLRILPLLVNDQIEWCLGNNPRKCTPEDLLEKSIYLCIPKDRLTSYAQLIFLIFNLTLVWLQGLNPEDVKKKFCLMLDETVALLSAVNAPLPALSNFLRCGAREISTIVICCQSIAGMYEVMGKDQTKDLVANTVYRYICDSSDSETSKEIIGWCGKYLKRKLSSSGSGTQQKTTISFENEDIIREQDLMALPQSGDVILVSNRAGYLRLQKCLVFKDKFFRKLLEAVKQSKSEREVVKNG